MDDKTGALEKLKAQIDQAEQIDEQAISVGDIIYVSLDEEDGLMLKDGYKDRYKYIVIIGFTPEGVAIGALLINSKISAAKRNKVFAHCQYRLIHDNYQNILNYDSWLDCSDIFEISKAKIIEKNGKRKGQLTPEDKAQVMQILCETELFDKATKKYYGIL